MSTFPDREFTSREQAVLKRTPYLRTFLDMELAKDNPLEWAKRMAIFEWPLKQSLEDKLGKDGLHALTVMGGFSLASVGLINQSASPTTPFELAESLVQIGFEVGNRDDLGSFHSRVFVSVSHFGLISTEALVRTSTGIDRSSRLLRGITTAGAYIADMGKGQELTNDPFRIFREFLEGPEYQGPNL